MAIFGWGSKEHVPSAADRDSTRHDISFRVRSRQLPGYRAITHDLSRSGLQLETENLLQKGSILELELEFDREEIIDFTCPAEVMWARPDNKRAKRFRAGLAFRPRTAEEKTNLVRMATVLQARSEADLDDLLEEARRLDSDRSATHARISGGDSPTPSAEPQTAAKPVALGGVFIPLSIELTGYSWKRASGTVELSFGDKSAEYLLYFPDCQLLHDHTGNSSVEVVGLYTTFQSKKIRELQAERGLKRWKHYRFVAREHQPILEIISAPVQTNP